MDARRRSPHGERGLKWRVAVEEVGLAMSLSSWRAWIEMTGATRSSVR